MTKKFEINCKNCGSKDVILVGSSGICGSEGALICNRCGNEEISSETDEK